MKSPFPLVRLSDVITFQRGHDLPRDKMIPGPYPVVGSNGILGYHNEYTTESPGVSIGRSGNVGNPFIVYTKSWSHNTCLYIKEYKGIDPIFSYYLLQTLPLSNYAGGTAVPTLNRNHISDLQIPLPPLPTQRAIAATLSCLDDKIACNRRMCAVLEEMAGALFEELTANHANHANGWTEGTLGDVCEVFTGKKNVNETAKDGKYIFFSCAPETALSNEYIYDGKAIIIAGNGAYTGRTQFYNGKFDLYQRTYACVPKTDAEKYIYLAYCTMKYSFEKEHLGGTRGSAIPYIVMG
ncbi:MAG: restriction endonuclease subunit S, partial [Spirochaetaceae bacterium]|nr:restriction endonuclease subunit S [Spirochaetaceae bacterium]